ncbi:hypothetical protein [Nesterenkonia sp.]|uniref:hypothetical protein n=1 Tax=Nesterenkonia sp. TaxID=704201 RepID=UPI0026038B25|nr:hypothetical protein [Nesterenkonia sp.]
MARYRFSRRRSRDYPLPAQGMRYPELTAALPRRDIQHAVRGGELLTPGRDLYIPAPESEAERHVATLQALCRGTEHLVSHHTAAALWGMVSREVSAPYHVTSPAASARIRRPGLVISHRSDVPAADRTMLAGLPITTPARTWIDVALTCPELEAVVLADRCRRRGRAEYNEDPRPLADSSELEAALRRRGRPRGIAQVRRALELSRDGVDSPQETRLRLLMRRAGLPEPEVNVWICDEHGQRAVQPDLSIRQYRVAIQYEGWEYHTAPEQMARDVRRQERTEALGWTEVRITRDHMRNGGAEAVQKIRRALRQRGWRG